MHKFIYKPKLTKWAISETNKSVQNYKDGKVQKNIIKNEQNEQG